MTPSELRDRLPALMLRDQRRLRRRLARARGPELDAIAEEIAAAEERVAQRRAAVPALRYPAELPITERRDDLLAAIEANQVVIVAGETGSGKSTQLPKLCLELGRGVQGLVGHTQPRRLAARAVAERVAEEVGSHVGGAVGYTVRFTDEVGDRTLVKLMTDGILLAEIQRDRDLLAYDTLIVDEAHERSLNIDFILGYLKQLLPRRPDLKVIVTSATIDTERFARHFDGAPVVEVSGRTYPVEVRYRPLVDEDADADRDQVQAIIDAVGELAEEGRGDVLVFLSGEREIRDTADALGRAQLRDTEILPLYARLSAAEQHRVFEPHRGRRIVLATNVAETSLTVPGIRYVVDPGTARISRYSRRTKVQRLPIERVSQASADQRAGRCGRVAPGICIRLYDEDDFASRSEYTDPEILRTNLGSVILQMAALGFGDIAAFPFVDPPDARSIKDGIALLEELGAFDPQARDPRKRLTPLGRRLAQLPLDPRLGRMVLEADRHGCVRDVMVIAAALSIQDPRERPEGKESQANEHHNRFVDPASDFVTLLNLWDHLRERQRALSSNQFRKLCRTEFLHYLRVREWQDIYSQLRRVAGGLGIRITNEERDPNRVHLALLPGLLSQIGMREGERGEYLGARNAKFAIARGSALYRKPPRWVMAAELVETNRMWARTVARIQPEWAERAGAHLVKRSYSEPHWDRDRGSVTAYERVTLYGVPIVASRKVHFGRVDPVAARQIFLRHALVEGDWDTHHAFFHDNAKLIDEVRALEDRARRRDLLVDDGAIYAFYDDRVPASVVSGRHFDQWWKRERDRRPDLLTFTLDDLVEGGAPSVDAGAYPDRWVQGDLDLAVTYEFEPGAEDDGVTVHVPLAVLNRVTADGFDWQVPGLREELVIALIRSLPKAVRRNFIPAPEYAEAFLTRVTPAEGPLLAALERELPRLAGEPLPAGSWRLDEVPDHLRVNFRIEDEAGTTVALGKDLDGLKRELQEPMRAAVSEAAQDIGQTGITTWSIGELPRSVQLDWSGLPVTAYPALADEGDSVAVRTFTSEAEQAEAMWAGTRRLLRLNVPSPRRALVDELTRDARLALARAPHAGLAELLDDCVDAAVDDIVDRHGGPAWDGTRFDALLEAVRDELVEVARRVLATVTRILAAATTVELSLGTLTAPALAPAVADVRAQLGRLVYAGFVTASGAARMADVLRYLQGIERRLEKLPGDLARDREHMARVQRLDDAYERVLATLPPGRPAAEVDRVHWMLEELRVSLFAQSLGTSGKVSDKRIERELDRLAAGSGRASGA